MTQWTRRFMLLIVVSSCLMMGATGARAQQQETSPSAMATNSAVGDSLAPARRQQLVQAIRRKFEQVVKQRLQLTDAQMVQLRQTNRHFEVQRRTLNERERTIRQQMRQELQPGIAANEPHLSALTDSLFMVQRARLDLLQQEQQELSGYMTVVQRVRYYALEDQLRQKLEQLRERLQAKAAAANGSSF